MKYCPLCGSTDLVQDAYATQNTKTGIWELASFGDNIDCLGCKQDDIDPVDKPPKKEKRKFRFHRGSLRESMETCVFVSDTQQLTSLLREAGFKGEKVSIIPYLPDARIGWNTHLVTLDGLLMGFTDGPLENPKTDPWATDPEFPLEDWINEVRANDTRLGYHDWIKSQREAN